MTFSSSNTCIAHSKEITEYLDTHKIYSGMRKVKRTIVFALVFLALFLIFNKFSIDIVKTVLKIKNQNFLFQIALNVVFWSLILSLLTCFFFFVYFTLKAMREFLLKLLPNWLFLLSILKIMDISFCLLATSIVSCALPNIKFTSDISKFKSLDGSVLKLVFITTSENLSKKTEIFSKIFESIVIYCFKNLIIFFLNFYINSRYLSERIDTNVKRIKYMMQLNNIVAETGAINIKTVASKVFNYFSLDKKVVNYQDMLKNFLESDAQELVQFIKENPEEGIEEEDIRDFYTSTLVEQNLIVNNIAFSTSTIKSLNKMLNLIFLPTILLIFATLGESNKNIKINQGNPLILITLIFSTSYAFSDIIKSFIASIYLVVFIRPFECQDLIKFRDNYWKVIDIGLLKTKLDNGSSIEVIPNSELATEPVSNLRLARQWTQSYKYKFNIDLFEKKKSDLLERIASRIKEKDFEIRRKCSFSHVKIFKNNQLEVSIDVNFKLDEPSIQLIQERSSQFLFELQNIIADIGLLGEQVLI